MPQVDNVRASDTDKSTMFGEYRKQLSNGHSNLDLVATQSRNVLIVIARLRTHNMTCIDTFHTVFGFELKEPLAKLLDIRKSHIHRFIKFYGIDWLYELTESSCFKTLGSMLNRSCYKNNRAVNA